MYCLLYTIVYLLVQCARFYIITVNLYRRVPVLSSPLYCIVRFGMQDGTLYTARLPTNRGGMRADEGRTHQNRTHEMLNKIKIDCMAYSICKY